MRMEFLLPASTGLSAAAVGLLTYLAVTMRNIEERLKKHEAVMARLLARVQRLSTLGGLPELESD